MVIRRDDADTKPSMLSKEAEKKAERKQQRR
jgi:hypothetical protein